MISETDKKEISKAFNKLSIFATFFLFLFSFGAFFIYKLVVLLEGLFQQLVIVGIILFVLFIIWYTINALIKYEFIQKNKKKSSKNK